MLVRVVPKTRISLSTSKAADPGFLLFLYCTRTILRSFSGVSVPRRQHGGDKTIDDGSRTLQSLFDEDAEGNAGSECEAFADSQDTNDRQSNRRPRARFGKEGFKVNELWETVLKPSPFRTKPLHKPSTDGQADSYAPFAGWAGSSSDSVETKPQKRLHKDSSHVPFTRLKTEQRKDPYADLEGTTITPTEKKAFESLFKSYKPSKTLNDGPEFAKSEQPSSGQTIVDQSKAKEDESGLDATLGKAMQDVQSSQTPKRPIRRQTAVPEFPEPIKKIRDATLASQAVTELQVRLTENGRRGTIIGRTRNEKFDWIAQKDVFEVRRLMQQAQTDVELWQILQSRVINRVLALGLDGFRPPWSQGTHNEIELLDGLVIENQDNDKATINHIETPSIGGPNAVGSALPIRVDTHIDTAKNPLAVSEDQTVDLATPMYPQPELQSTHDTALQVLSRSFPQHLVVAFRTLALHFPASPLPFNILPIVKSVGPSSATLGLSSQLYNQHIRHHWRKYHNPLAINDILQEMDEDVYEFDEEIRKTIRLILDELYTAERGLMGVVPQLISKMDRYVLGKKLLRRWMRIMVTRLEDEELRKVREKEAMELEEQERRRLRLESIDELGRLGTDEDITQGLAERDWDGIGREVEQDDGFAEAREQHIYEEQDGTKDLEDEDDEGEVEYEDEGEDVDHPDDLAY